MNILIAMDSFKGSMSAIEACESAAKGLTKALPDSNINCLPLADGGEGLIEALRYSPNFIDSKLVSVNVLGSYGEKTASQYLIHKKTAIIEMAQCCGLYLTPLEQRDIKLTTTYGIGELVIHAIESGCNHLIIGLGGSATNDGGIGFAQALGVNFYNKEGNLIPSPARAIDMQYVERVDISNLSPLLQNIQIEICCDVNNVLLGEKGATKIYGKQKGASDSDLFIIENAMSQYTKKVELKVNKKASTMAGSGAAGGLGASIIWFTNAKLTSGIELVLNLINFDKIIKDSDLILTGEGKIDQQTIFGKVITGIAKKASALNIPVIGLCGTADLESLTSIPYINAIKSITQGPISITESMEKGNVLMESCCEQLGYILEIGKKIYIDHENKH